MSISKAVMRVFHRTISRSTLTGLAVAGGLVGTSALAVSPALGAGLPEQPVAKPAGSVTSNTATLNGEVNPGAGGEEVEYDFAYNVGAGCTGGPVAPEPPATAVGNHQNVSVELTGLQPDTQYAFCVIATNSTGPVSSSPVTFTTLASKPSIDAEGSSGITPSEATLEAAVNANNQTTECEFQYGKTATYGTTVPCEQPPFEGFGDQGAEVRLTGLEAGATYHFKVVVKNATGTSESPDQQFTTQGSPLVTTGSAQGATRNTMLLSGTVDPVGLETTYRFEYISEAGYQAALGQSAGNPYAQGESTVPVNAGSGYETLAVGPEQAGGLLPGVAYHYALVASNALGVTIGHDATFTTAAPALPIVATGGATGVAQNTANISATINTQGLATNYGFEIGTDTNYGPPTGLGAVGAGANEAVVSLSLSGLQPDTTYHYRIVATNVDGTTYGADMTFTTSVFANAFVTPPAPLPFVAVPAVSFPTEAGTQPVVSKKAVKKKSKKVKHKKKPAKSKHKTASKKKK